MSSSSRLPRLDRSRPASNERVAFGKVQTTPAPIVLGTADGELAQEVLPFELDLTARDGDELDRTHSANLRAVETVPPPRRLSMNGAEVGRYRGTRSRVRLEADQLRMMTIASGPSLQHRACK